MSTPTRKQFRTRMKGGGFTIIPSGEIHSFLDAYREKKLTKADVRLWAGVVLRATAKEGAKEREALPVTICTADYSETISEDIFGAVRRISLDTAKESVEKLKGIESLSGLHKRLRDARNLWGSDSIRVSRLVLRLAATGRISPVEFSLMLLYFVRRSPDYKRLEYLKDFGVEFYGRITRNQVHKLTGASLRSISAGLKRLGDKGLLTSIDLTGESQGIRRYGYLLIDGEALADYLPVDNSIQDAKEVTPECNSLHPSMQFTSPPRGKRSEELDLKKENYPQDPKVVPVVNWVSFGSDIPGGEPYSFMKVSESTHRNSPNEMQGNRIQEETLQALAIELTGSHIGDLWKIPSLVDARRETGVRAHSGANYRLAA